MKKTINNSIKKTSFKGLKRISTGSNNLGIVCNHGLVEKFMHFTGFDYYVNLLKFLLLTTGKTLLYLASGTEDIDRYNSFDDYSNIILVDYQFRDTIHIDYSQNKRIICLNLDAYIAIHILLRLNHRIDTLVVFNEGLEQGGGNMNLAENAFALLFPILSENPIFIVSRKYYGMTQRYKTAKPKNWLNLPFKSKTELHSEDKGYIDPDLFTVYNFCKGKGEVVQLSNKVRNEHIFQRGRIKVHVLHSSLYNHLEKIDLGLTHFENGYQEEIFRTGITNVLNWRGEYMVRRRISRDTEIIKSYNLNDIGDLNKLCIDYSVKKLGLVPNASDYVSLINQLNEMENEITDIYFFHLHHGDYKILYQEV